MENLNLMEERGGFTASASTETAEHQNSVTQPADSGGQVTPDTAVDTGGEKPDWLKRLDEELLARKKELEADRG